MEEQVVSLGRGEWVWDGIVEGRGGRSVASRTKTRREERRGRGTFDAYEGERWGLGALRSVSKKVAR